MSDADFFDDLRDKRIAQIRPLLTGTFEQAERLLPNSGWNPSAGSPFRDELQRLPSAEHGACLREHVHLAQIGVYATVDHARTISSILDRLDSGVLGVFVVARAGLEGSARACWLLESGLSPLTRLYRGLAYRWSCATWQEKIAQAYATMPRDGEDTTQSIRLLAARLGVEVEGNGVFCGETNKKETQLVDDFVASNGDPSAKGHYAVLSSITHTRPMTELFLRDPFLDGDESGGVHLRPRHLIPAIQGPVYVILIALLRSISASADYIGTADNTWAYWHNHVLRRLQGWI